VRAGRGPRSCVGHRLCGGWAMKRSGFKRPLSPVRVRPVYAPPAEPVRAVMRRADGNDRMTVAVPKVVPRRSEPYRRWVASLPCAHCSRVGHSQAAHADQDKGTGTKTDDGTCYPLCATQLGEPGCHDRIGASGDDGKAARRELEAKHGEATRALAKSTGHWPKGWE
jgi:hypothetical protein